MEKGNNENLIRASEAAKLLGVHPSTIKRWIEIGRLRVAKEGNTAKLRKELWLNRDEVLALKGE